MICCCIIVVWSIEKREMRAFHELKIDLCVENLLRTRVKTQENKTNPFGCHNSRPMSPHQAGICLAACILFQPYDHGLGGKRSPQIDNYASIPFTLFIYMFQLVSAPTQGGPLLKCGPSTSTPKLKFIGLTTCLQYNL